MNIENYKGKLSLLFSEYGVVLAYLFGSQAREKTGPLSDIDIAILFDEGIDKTEYVDRQIELITRLMGIFHRNEVDVVILNTASPLLAFNVIRDGVVLYDPQNKQVEFKVRTLNRYFDTEFLRQVQRDYLKKWLQERRKYWMEDMGKW